MGVPRRTRPSPRLLLPFVAVAALAPFASGRAAAQPSAEDKLSHRWHLLKDSEPPKRPPYTEGVAVYDGFRRRVLIHEGDPDSVFGLSVDDYLWRRLRPVNEGPTSRGSHAAIFDPTRRNLVVFGGTGGFEGRLNDVWALDTRRRVWSRLDDPTETDRPATRSNASAVYDPHRDRMLVFGGISGVGFARTVSDLWEFDLGRRRWRRIPPGGGTVPKSRLGHGAIFDVKRDRMLVWSGQFAESLGVQNLRDLWQFDCVSETWSEIPLAGADVPPVSLDGSFLTDGQHRGFAFGGWSGTQPPIYNRDVFVIDLQTDVWRKLPDLNGTGVEQPGGGGPGRPRPEFKTLPPIAHHVAAFVPGNRRAPDQRDRPGRIVLFGGDIQRADGTLEFRNDTWIYRRPTLLHHF